MADADLDHDTYKAVRACLDLSHGVLVIEVLPSQSHAGSASAQTPLILVDNSSIGIPKETLIRSFLVARRHLQRFLKAPPESPEEVKNALCASFVVLLFDPEHLTAANLRKRILSTAIEDVRRDDYQRSIQQAIQIELAATETLLTSPLNRHTKSPTLWYHRQWVWGQWRELYHDDDTFRKSHNARWMWEHVCRSDLLVAARSGEQHPKNYYAWSYARWLVEYFSPDIEETLASSLADGIGFVQAWCLKHQSDISGWSFLLFLYSRAAVVANPADVTLLKEIIIGNVETTLNYALSFNWDLESVWVFLRTTLAMPSLLPVGKRLSLTQKVKEKIEQNERDEVEGKGKHSVHFMRAAISWIEANS